MRGKLDFSSRILIIINTFSILHAINKHDEFASLLDEKKVCVAFENNRDSKRQMIRKHYGLEQARIKWIRTAGDRKIASASDT